MKFKIDIIYVIVIILKFYIAQDYVTDVVLI
jgi:hypothetical protein